MKGRIRVLGLIAVIAIATIATVSVEAQTPPPPPPPPVSQVETNTPVMGGPAADAWQFLTASGSNWMAAVYGIYDSGTEEYGAGIGIGYKVSDYVVPTLRCDYLNKEIWMPSASLQLQLPVKIMGAVTVVPFTFAGIATPLSGTAEENGTVVGIFGAGGALRMARHWDAIFDVEKWTGADFKDLQYRFGFVYKF